MIFHQPQSHQSPELAPDCLHHRLRRAQNIDLRLAKEGKHNNKLKHPIKQPYRGLQLRHEPPCLLDNLYIYIYNTFI